MISDVIVDTGRERGSRVPISIQCLAGTVQSPQATMQSLPHCLSKGEIPPHHCPPIPSTLSTMLSSLRMPQNSALFPWPQLNPAQRIGLTCYLDLSMGADSSSLHEGTRGLLQASSPMSLLGPHPCLCSVVPQLQTADHPSV